MKLEDLKKYQIILFDCDGVLLNSNNLKTNAFYQAVINYGEKAAQSLIEHHKKNGGVSRYRKFEFFFREIIGVKANEKMIQDLLQKFAEEVEKGIQNCESVSNLQLLREYCEHTKWIVVSGGNQNEVRKTLNARCLANYFDGGIYGSPDTKEEIIKKYVYSEPVSHSILYIGDSKYDYEITNLYGYDFLCVSEWSEWKDWQNYQREYKFESIDNLEKWIKGLSG